MTNRFHARQPSTVIAIGMLMLVAANLCRWILHPGPHLSVNTLDCIVGFSYGVSIGAMLLGVGRLSRQRKSGTCR